MSTRKNVKLLEVYGTKLFRPVITTNRNLNTLKLINVPVMNRNNECLASMSSWFNHSPRLLTNYTNLPTYAYLSTSTPATSAINDLKIIRIKKTDTELVVQFLRRFFYRDEPLLVAQNVLPTAETICPELEHVSVKCIVEEVSFMATAPNGDTLGVCLNRIILRDDPEKKVNYSNKKIANIFTFLKTMDKEANVFSKYPDVNKVFYIDIISINSSYRGSGISEAFIERNWALARELNCTLMRCDCTSFYSARMLARLGFDCIYRLKYADYKENGKPVFNPEHPHEAGTVCVQYKPKGSSN